jgi:putative transposase
MRQDCAIMARIARIVVPGYPHHIMQRGNHREETFFSDQHYQYYLNLMAEWCTSLSVAIWAYCVVMIPARKEFLGEAIESTEEYRELRQHERTRRPLGGALFIDKQEEFLRRQLRRRKPGPKGAWKHRDNE